MAPLEALPSDNSSKSHSEEQIDTRSLEVLKIRKSSLISNQLWAVITLPIGLVDLALKKLS